MWNPSFFVAGAQEFVTVTALLELGAVIDIRIRSINQVGVRASSFVEVADYEVGSTRTGVDSNYDFGQITDQPSPITVYDFGEITDTPSPITVYDFGSV